MTPDELAASDRALDRAGVARGALPVVDMLDEGVARALWSEMVRGERRAPSGTYASVLARRVDASADELALVLERAASPSAA